MLQRYTPLQVLQIQDGMRVEPNCVYVIPPNRNLAMLHGTLYLLEREASKVPSEKLPPPINTPIVEFSQEYLFENV